MVKKERNILNVAKRMPKILSIFLMFFALATIFLTIESSAQGGQLLRLEERQASIESENQELRSTLVTYTSLSKISEDAQKLGMIKPESLTYISKAWPTGLVNSEKPVARVP